MVKSGTHHIERLSQEIEEIKKYQSDLWNYNSPIKVGILNEFQSLLDYQQHDPTTIRFPDSNNYSLTPSDVELLESQYTEYTRISDTDYFTQLLGPMYLVCVFAIYQLLVKGMLASGGNAWNSSVLYMVSTIFLCCFFGLFLTVLSSIILFPISSLIKRFMIPRKISIAGINLDKMNKYVAYQESIYHYLRDLSDSLIKSRKLEIVQIETELSQIQRKKEEFWVKMDGHKFEREIEKLLRSVGHSVERTRGSGDMGVDLILNADTIIQCKATKSAVSPSVARDLLGTMTHFNKTKGILISAGGFTSGTKSFCQDNNIELWDLDRIIGIAESVK